MVFPLQPANPCARGVDVLEDEVLPVVDRLIDCHAAAHVLEDFPETLSALLPRLLGALPRAKVPDGGRIKAKQFRVVVVNSAFVEQVVRGQKADDSLAVPDRRPRRCAVPHTYVPIVVKGHVLGAIDAGRIVWGDDSPGAVVDSRQDASLVAHVPVFVDAERADHVRAVLADEVKPEPVETETTVPEIHRAAAELVERRGGGQLTRDA
jgi:hypothetical protein